MTGVQTCALPILTIKYDGVEISAKSAEQAMELLEKLKERKAEIAEKADAGEN